MSDRPADSPADAPRPPTVVRSASAPALAVAGDVYSILVDGSQTGGAYSLVEAHVPEGGGPPRHVQSREDEGFFVLEGRFTFHVGDAVHDLGPGDFANVPRGTPHFFRGAGPGRNRMLFLNAPAGVEGLFRRVGIPVPGFESEAPALSPEEIGRMASIAPEYGVTILKPD